MRLQLAPSLARPPAQRMQRHAILSLLCIALFANNSYSQDRDTGEGKATSRTLVYSDDDATTVVSVYTDAEVVLPANIVVKAHALVDAVSTASVDVTSAATGRWEEERIEAGLFVGGIIGKQEFFLGVVQSTENDWRSLSVSVGTAREFFQKNTKVSASLGYTDNIVGRAQDPNFEKSLGSLSMELGVSQLLDRKTRVSGTYTFQYLDGFQSSPYRYLTTLDRVSSAEIHPNTRLRHALSAGLVRSLHQNVALRASYRLYRDDWGIWSHTGTLGFRFAFAKYFGVSIDGRVYQQNRADFYRNSYRTTFRYMSFDRELSTFRDLGGQASLQAKLGPVLLDAKAGIIDYRFRNFDRLPKRRAYLLGGGAKLTW